MPSFGEASSRDWAQMYASTSIASYDLMDKLRAGPRVLGELSPREAKAAAELLEAGWIADDGNGQLSLSDDGLKHLKSF